VTGELLSVKRVGAHHLLTLVAPGVAERFRPGTLVAVTVGGPMTERLTRRTFPIHRVRATGAYGATVEIVVDVPAEGADPGVAWLVAAPPGTAVDVLGPLGRPFALPKEPVTCTLVGVGAASAPLFPLAERLRERGCAVHMLLGGATDGHVFGALEARRATRGVTVSTEDGSVGIAGTVDQVLPDLLSRSASEVVYAAGPAETLHAVAAVAEAHGAWSQTMVDTAMPCGTGLCLGCTLPVVGEDGVTRMVRACTEGPVFRGDRVRWAELAAVPEGAR
jgi:dihydroorotate dehydrogenase electron transfer subunit